MVGIAVMLKIGQQESNEDDIKELQNIPSCTFGIHHMQELR